MKVYNSRAGGTVLQQTYSKEAEASEGANVSCRKTWFVSPLLVHVSFNVGRHPEQNGWLAETYRCW
jgi:hypothetical protein